MAENIPKFKNNPVVFFNNSKRNLKHFKIQSNRKFFSIYVGNIKESFSEIGLYYLFSEVGPVDSVKLCRNINTGKHIGFGYIDFKNKQDANKVIENIDLHSIFKKILKTIKIMWKDADDSLRESGYCNIFVKNLSSGFDLKDLYNLFICFGQILSSKIALDENRRSLEFGFINFENQYSADHAIEKINGKKINGKKIFVGPFIKKEKFNLLMQKKKGFSVGHRNLTNIYIKNLNSVNFTDKYLKGLFGVFGEITSIFIPKDHEDKPKGFAFINFSSSIEAEDAIFKMNNKIFGDFALYVNRAIKKETRERIFRGNENTDVLLKNKKYINKTIIVKNLEMKNKEKLISSEFSVLGEIINCKILKKGDSVSSGLFFFTFKNQPDLLNVNYIRKKYRFLRKLTFGFISKPFESFIKKKFKSISKTSKKKCGNHFEDKSNQKKKKFSESFFFFFFLHIIKFKRKNSKFLFHFHLTKNFQRKFSSRLSFFTSNLNLEKSISLFFCKKKLRNQTINYFTRKK